MGLGIWLPAEWAQVEWYPSLGRLVGVERVREDWQLQRVTPRDPAGFSRGIDVRVGGGSAAAPRDLPVLR